MHDEVFITTAGVVRFHMPSPNEGEEEKIIDAKLGDTVTVPIKVCTIWTKVEQMADVVGSSYF